MPPFYLKLLRELISNNLFRNMLLNQTDWTYRPLKNQLCWELY